MRTARGIGRAMSVLPPSLSETLAVAPSPWGRGLDDDALGALDAQLAALPSEVQVAVLSALADPTRALWARGLLDGLRMAAQGRAEVLGMGHEEVVELQAESGVRFGLAALPFPQSSNPWGHQPTIDELTARLDQTFDGRPYVLYLRRPLPQSLDVDGIVRAFRLWLAAVNRGERHEQHAVYEDGDVAFEVTLADPDTRTGSSPRLLTVGPISTLERLAEVDMAVVEAAVRVEEAVGAVPVVFACASDRPWRLPRGYVEQLLYGTSECTVTSAGDGRGSYRARFRPNGRSLFSDPVCRHLSSLWWVEPGHGEGAATLASEGQVTDNPWAREAVDLSLPVDRFAPTGPAEQGTGVVTMQWSGRPS